MYKVNIAVRAHKVNFVVLVRKVNFAVRYGIGTNIGPI